MPEGVPSASHPPLEGDATIPRASHPSIVEDAADTVLVPDILLY
jgi:hypothetical protein